MGECFMFGRGKLELYKPNFADNDWSKIISACQSGKVPDTWAVGDQKAMTINGTDYLIDIIGKNHDEYSDGTGTAPLTFQMHDCYGTTAPINPDYYDGHVWSTCAMRTTHLPAILALMPSEVQTAIRAVNKQTAVGNGNYAIDTTSEKLFLLSEFEIFGGTSYSIGAEGSQYSYYTDRSSKKKTRNGSSAYWWTRSPYKSSSNFSCCVDLSGYSQTQSVNTLYAVAPAFCF